MNVRTALNLSLRITDTRDGSVLDRSYDHFPVRIGRNALNDLPLEFKFVSQFHAVLDKTATGSVTVRDVGSRNGTMVGGRPLPAHERIDLAQTGYAFESALSGCSVRCPRERQGRRATSERR